MSQARPLPAFAPLSTVMVRRRSPRRLMLPAPAAFAAPMAEPDSTWREDLRFFLACYAAGVVFFLVMLS